MAKDKLKIITAMVIFGTIGPVRKQIPCSSALVACVRGVIGALFLLFIRLLQKKPLHIKRLGKGLVWLLASGAMIGINWILLFEAYRYTSVSVATVCYYMAPVFVILASPLVLREALTLRKIGCCLAALVGIFLLSGVWQTGFSGLGGVTFGLSAAVFYAGVILLNKKITGITGEDRTLIQLSVVAVTLLIYVLCTENLSSLSLAPYGWGMLALAGIYIPGLLILFIFPACREFPVRRRPYTATLTRWLRCWFRSCCWEKK